MRVAEEGGEAVPLDVLKCTGPIRLHPHMLRVLADFFTRLRSAFFESSW